MKKKKTYNIFKMFGSYIGLLIGLFLGISVNLVNSIITVAANSNFYVNDFSTLQIVWQLLTYFQTIYFTIGGFIICYIIHILFRKFKK